MRWGIRRYQNPDGSLTDLGKKRYSRIVGSKNNVSVLERKRRSSGDYEILDKAGKKVGNAIVDDKTEGTHLDWLGVKSKERRKGYGQEALDIIIQDSIERGKKWMTLDAAGLDPAAIHIYEKKGFKAVQQIDSDIWNELIVMKKDL